MHFNGGTKWVEIFDEAEPKFVPLEKVSWSYPNSVDSDQGLAGVSLRGAMNCCS
jgi:hypothetical protein